MRVVFENADHVGVGLLATATDGLALRLLGLGRGSSTRRTRWLQAGSQKGLAQIILTGRNNDLVPFLLELWVYDMHEGRVIVPSLSILARSTFIYLRASDIHCPGGCVFHVVPNEDLLPDLQRPEVFLHRGPAVLEVLD